MVASVYPRGRPLIAPANAHSTEQLTPLGERFNAGIDRLFGHRETDELEGNSGDDLLSGGRGFDLGFGGRSADTCRSVEFARSCCPEKDEASRQRRPPVRAAITLSLKTAWLSGRRSQRKASLLHALDDVIAELEQDTAR